MLDYKNLKEWMDDVYNSDKFTKELFDKSFLIKGNDEILTDLNELIHQLDITDEWDILKHTPEFLLDYYMVQEKCDMTEKDFNILRKKLIKIVKSMGEFDTYEDFKEALEKELNKNK